MKVLLDECVDEGLRNYFSGHDCQTARYAGFAGLENGELLAAAEDSKFDVVLTVDRGFEYQQNLNRRKIAIIIFCGKSVLLSGGERCAGAGILHLPCLAFGTVGEGVEAGKAAASRRSPRGEQKAKNNICFLFAMVLLCSSSFSTGAPCVAL